MRVPVDALPKLLLKLGTLAHVLPWGVAQRPQWVVVDVVIQDEYTHDVILAADGEQRTIALDCT